ncbi:MAG: LVIVD repeat-containing protein [Chloroflexia bacterium]
MPIDRIIRSGRVTELAAALALLILLVALAGCTADPRSATLTSPVPPTATTLRQLPPSASWPTDHTPASLPASSLTAQPPGTPTSSAEPAAEPPALPVIGSLGGSLGALAVAGDWAYLAEGQGLTVLDVHDPNQPQARGRLALSALIHDLAAAQGRVYVAAGEQGLLLINVDDPAHPVLSGRLAPSPLGNTQAVQLVGDLAYVVDGTGLRIADVHDAAHPVLLGSLDLVAPTDPSSWAVHLQVVGPFAYVALSAGGLAVVDIRAPAHPVLSGRYTARFVPTLQRPDSPGAVGNLQVVGHLAYLAAGDGGLEIVDVTDPSHPVLRGYQATPPQDPAVDVQVVDGLAYVIYAPDSAWGPRAPHLEVIDVGHPARPTTCARVDLPQVPVNLRIGDGRAYLTSASDLRIWDLAVPCGPSRRGHYMPLGPARDLQVVDGVAYVATSAGLQLVDVRDPARPPLQGRGGTNCLGV